MGLFANAAEKKARGEQPSRLTSFAVAAAAGAATGFIVYRVLRSA